MKDREEFELDSDLKKLGEVTLSQEQHHEIYSSLHNKMGQTKKTKHLLNRLSIINTLVLTLFIGGSLWYFLSTDSIDNQLQEPPVIQPVDQTQDIPIGPEGDPDEENNHIEGKDNLPRIITEERVIEDATYFLHLIKEKDIDTLVELWFSLYYITRPTLFAELDIYNHYKDIDKHMAHVVETFHELLDFESDFMVEVPYYSASNTEFYVKLLNNNDINFSEGTAVDSWFDNMIIYYYQDQPYFQQLIFEYYPFAYESMLEYVRAIQEEDLWALGSLFAGHGAQYPDEFYNEIINNYKKIGIDIPSMTPVLTKFDPNKLFVIDITDKNGFTHQINITYRSGHGDRQIVDINIPPREDWILLDY